MLKRNSHRQSDNQLRYSSLTKNDESEFNLGKFRESVYSKMQQLGNQEQQSYVKGTVSKTVKSSQVQEMRGSIPSFEDICKKMSSYKDSSHNILKHDGSLRSSIQCKIEQFAEPPQSRLSQRSVGMTLHISNRFASQTKLDTKQQSTGKFTSSFIEKPVITQPLKTSLIDKLPLKELSDIIDKWQFYQNYQKIVFYVQINQYNNNIKNNEMHTVLEIELKGVLRVKYNNCLRIMCLNW